MTFDTVNRRTHLYLAMFLLPWFFMYGLSSIPFSHHGLLDETYKDQPRTTLRFDREYHIDVPDDADASELRRIGAKILQDNGMEDRAFGVYRPNADTLIVYLPHFRTSGDIKYFLKEGRLRAEDNTFRWDHFLTGMHARGGFAQDMFLPDAWGVMVDFVMIAILIWIASGIYMWFTLRQTRLWGSLALAGGVLTMAGFLVGL